MQLNQQRWFMGGHFACLVNFLTQQNVFTLTNSDLATYIHVSLKDDSVQPPLCLQCTGRYQVISRSDKTLTFATLTKRNLELPR